MADKSGTLQQQRNACFPTTTAKATGGCPLTGPDVAIVPMRYALDRSRYDEDPKKLKPLLKSGKWSALPSLKTRGYTLRQLYKGYVYVYDETDKTLHEYIYSTSTGQLTRIKWTDADTGKDKRSSAGESKSYLLYPRKNNLHIAYSRNQWTWKICEHMRSNPGSRKDYMTALDLPTYCITQSVLNTLPLLSLADAAADVDKDAVKSDKRFGDSAIPTIAPEGKVDGEPIFCPVAADIFWTGSVPDKDSSLVVVIDDPLAVLNDLGTQLIADQAAYQIWQEEHEHKIQIAQTVEALCGANVADENKLPASVRGSPIKKRQYQRDLDIYYSQLENERQAALFGGMSGSPNMIAISETFKSADIRKQLKTQYNSLPTEADFKSWQAREKWRREVNLDGAHAYIQTHEKNGNILLDNIRKTQYDFKTWAKHIGTEPLRLFIDTTNIDHLHYLQETAAQLLQVLIQDIGITKWLAKEDAKATTLFGTIRFGFSPGLKDAFETQGSYLLSGIGDMTTLATRAGELNGVLSHEGFADKAWMKALKQPVQDTFSAVKELAAGKGKNTAEAILLALVPSDSRLAMGKTQNIQILARNLLIGHILTNATDRPAIDEKIGEKLKAWKQEWKVLNKQINDTRRQWLYPDQTGQRKSLARTLQIQETKLQTHELKIPGILDYKNNKYAELMREEIRNFARLPANIAKDWNTKAKAWGQKFGMNAGAVTWGVIMLNLINTAIVYKELTSDGEFSAKDITKFSYGLGYSLNLLMAVYIETPWNLIKNAKPVIIDSSEVGILNKSAEYWRVRGKNDWASAVGKFKFGLVAAGAFGLAAASAEIWDIIDDFGDLESQAERTAATVKFAAVAGMAASGLLQLLAGLNISGQLVAVVMNPWFAVATLIIGVIYLFATIALNYFKHDGIGSWLKKCAWSISKEGKYQEDADGRAEEKRALLEIQLSPQIFVKGTFEEKNIYTPRVGYLPVKVQNGAWIQLRLPNAIRGKLLEFNITNSKRPLGIFPVSKTSDLVQDPFLDKGQFVNTETFENISNKPYSRDPYAAICPAPPPENQDIVWQTWVPASENADFVEMQIWYPKQILKPGADDRGYLYQVEIDQNGVSKVDGLSTKTLEVKSSNRANSLILAVTE
ncbi:hypothetical protein JFT81_14375 [Pseudomonas sp. TH43]|uniref:toxin VasX n=1 Tax=Pseudomonas sp. TH43 TaxID=2796407 RepID=UPI00191169B6|nr:toxin VasX [Pseudomonas sp. TH43]MBK5375819.1 hypothetical protein [Pseudomonas sp. TH43]